MTLNLNPATPSSSRMSAKSTPATARSRATPKSTASRRQPTTLKRELSDDGEEGSDEVDYKARDLTPTPLPRPDKKQKTAAAPTTVDLTSESEDNVQTPANESFAAATQTSDPKTTQSQSFYGTDSFASALSMEDTLLDPTDMHGYEDMYYDPEI